MPALLSVRLWLSEHKMLLAGLIVVLVMASLFSAQLLRVFDDLTNSRERLGVVESFHHKQWFTGADDPLFYVRLANGELVLTNPPPGTRFVRGASVRVEEREFASGRREYSFLEYANAASDPAIHSDTVRSPLRAPHGARHRER